MAQVKFFKLNALPGTLVADAIYFIYSGSGNFIEGYVTDSSGNAKGLGNSAMISAIAQGLINASLADFNAIEIVADIAARNALAAGKQRNFLVLVTNATGDNTVASGAASYAWNEVTQTFTKLTEFESLDVQLTWANISGKPNSTPAQIDLAVTNSHTHANKATLDLLASDGSGNLTFNGSVVAAQWTAVNW